MLKLDTLRAAITEALPELARSPENLRIWIERGVGESHGTRTDAFGFRFEANVLIVEMASDIAVLALALFRWARTNQPELLAPNRDGFSFDVDILDNATADVLVKIDVRQNVTASALPGGGYSLAYLPEPDPLMDDELPLAGTLPITNLAGVIVEDLPF